MKIYLRDKNKEIVDAWTVTFEGLEGFEISAGDIFIGAPKADAIVSPANSFGFMDGGIDAIYSFKFGWDLQARLQEYLKKEHYGELPVGQAVIIPTNNSDYPWLISAPTMRIPAVVKYTANAFLAFRATLLAIKEFNEERGVDHIESILCPGLGTAVGQMTPWSCAKQMREAYEAIWLEKPYEPKSIEDIYYHHREMVTWEKFINIGNKS